MPHYIKKPIPVEAIKMKEKFTVITLEGIMQGNPGDYLCTDHKGNQYPCRSHIFEEIYIKYNPNNLLHKIFKYFIK